MPLALLALAICAFAIGTTEFVATGLLPDFVRDFHISIPQAGYITMGYALGVVISAPILTLLLLRFNRKKVLIFLMLLFLAGSLLSALAATFTQLMLGRILSSFCHGAFFGIGSVVATKLVAPNKQASAIALMFSGLTLANVVGVPLGTLFGQSMGWRSAFWAIAVLALIGLIGLVRLIPAQSAQAPSIRGELAEFRKPQVWLALLVTTIGFSGLFAMFAYIAPLMIEVVGFAPQHLAWILSLFGVGLVLGNLVSGRLADRHLHPTLLTMLGLLALLLLLLTVSVGHPVAVLLNVFLLGAIGFGTVPPLQMYLMSQAQGAPTLASAANISAFNLGAAAGVWLGGEAIARGFGLLSPSWVGAAMSGLGLLVALYALRRQPRALA
ncbi:MAG: MFS transporter [Neisseriaceae bacterium]|nr:MFS transporter [Neisseriaceae bacterium]MBP6861182.1 MFS transporter [Neisseriaceae bacterium]